MASAAKVCKDCPPGIKKNRPAPHPGPRCATHWRQEVKRREARAHEMHVQKTYGLPPGGYESLYAVQGGVCAICGPRAKGISKRLAVDHDHATGAVRGLCCTACNRLLGHARDSAEFFERAAEYLRNPPAKRFGWRVTQ